MNFDKDDLTARLEKVIDEEINPVLQEHSGWIELVDVFPEDRACTIRFRGQCAACSAVDGTMDSVIVPKIRHFIREIRHIDIDDEVDEDVWEMAKKLFTHRTDEQ